MSPQLKPRDSISTRLEIRLDDGSTKVFATITEKYVISNGGRTRTKHVPNKEIDIACHNTYITIKYEPLTGSVKIRYRNKPALLISGMCRGELKTSGNVYIMDITIKGFHRQKP